MSVGVLVAVGPTTLEPVVLAAASAPGLHVVRRCLDTMDLLAAATAGEADIGIVSTLMAGLDAELVERIGSHGVLLIGVVRPDVTGDERALVRLGVTAVPADEFDDLLGLIDRLESSRAAAEHPAEPASGDSRTSERAPRVAGPTGPPGAVIAVWGPTGAPGRTTVAMLLGALLARRGTPTLLVDADVYGGTVAQRLGLLDESSGLLASARAANDGSLTSDVLARHARRLDSRSRVLTGLPRSDRWVELPPVLLRRVLRVAADDGDTVVVDLGFSLEQDEEVSYDTAVPRRNGATFEALSTADRVVVVGAADPVSLGRLLRAVSDVSELVERRRLRLVVNRVRPSLGWSADDIRDIVRRTSGLEVAALLPDDPRTCDRAVVHGTSPVDAAGRRGTRPLVRAARALATRLGTELAAELTPELADARSPGSPPGRAADRAG